MNPIKWGIIGPGKIAKKFAVALTLAGGAKLQAVASRDGSKARSFAQEYGAPTHYDNYEALVKDPEIDAVYIATPHGFHFDHTILCLRHNKPVLCEKPMALYHEQVQRMVMAARDNQTFLMEAMWTRFTPTMNKVLSLIGEGRLGSIKYIRADFGFKGPYSPDNRLFNLSLGGGSLLDIGIYPLFLSLQILGAPDHIRASGHLASTGADESCQAILQYDTGSAGTIYSSFAAQTSISAEIAGTEGMIQLPTPWHKTETFTLLRPGEDPEVFQLPPMPNGFEFQIREVARCLENGWIESPMMSHEFSLLMSSTMDEIREQIGVKYPGE